MIQRNAVRLHRRNGVDMAVGYDFVNQQCLRNAQRWEEKASSGDESAKDCEEFWTLAARLTRDALGKLPALPTPPNGEAAA